ncbi:hypothetical protein [Wielerella bovis]|uniref:hypothetical protein n=1 Tax=Wielerella bovis TaxID=2917790 RepID=UPI00201852F7|nr:hypothetical protein [Wielerella bovis]MCG7656145.1 hypothetical protein [Wielerella bovis]MCG7658370.1 hypothetical protein [Wielerella bovis]
MIEFPIFVFEGYSVDIFKTMLDFQNKIEPIDIQNNHFTIFDSKGNNLTFSVVTKKHLFCFFVETIVFHTSYPDYEHFFEQISMVYNETFNQSVSNMSMEEIQNELIKFYGFTH